MGVERIYSSIVKRSRCYGNRLENTKQMMASMNLSRSGLYFDDVNKVRIWDPEAAIKTKQLKDVSADFINKISEFHGTSSRLLSTVEELASHVDREKMKALGASNKLMSMAKEREIEKQKYQALIVEKSSELERLRVEYQSLLRAEAERQELMEKFQVS